MSSCASISLLQVAGSEGRTGTALDPTRSVGVERSEGEGIGEGEGEGGGEGDEADDGRGAGWSRMGTGVKNLGLSMSVRAGGPSAQQCSCTAGERRSGVTRTPIWLMSPCLCPPFQSR